MGLVEKSSVTAYLEEYYEKHPLDNSYEGVLARRSGLTKENVIALLNYAEDLVFLANYNSANYNRTRSIASTSKIKSRLTAALVINSFESRPADLVTTVTDHPERTGRYHPYVSESLLRDIRSNHTVLGCLPLLFPQCCR